MSTLRGSWDTEYNNKEEEENKKHYNFNQS